MTGNLRLALDENCCWNAETDWLYNIGRCRVLAENFLCCARKRNVVVFSPMFFVLHARELRADHRNP